jgi:hypothetical protein
MKNEGLPLLSGLLNKGLLPWCKTQNVPTERKKTTFFFYPGGVPLGNVIKLRDFSHRCTQINTDLYICVHPFYLWLNHLYLYLELNLMTLPDGTIYLQTIPEGRLLGSQLFNWRFVP